VEPSAAPPVEVSILVKVRRLETFPVLIHKYQWSVLGAGRNQMPITYVRSNHEHKPILKAIRAGDAKACAMHLRGDIESATAGLLKRLG
jgi:DNA-binding GntR family transcriptional regulator